jgi:hypothetical protein
MPMANLTGEGVKDFVEKEQSLIGSFIMPNKKAASRGKVRARTARPKAAAV